MSVTQSRMIADLRERLNDALALALDASQWAHREAGHVTALPLQSPDVPRQTTRAFDMCIHEPCIRFASTVADLRKSRLSS